MEPIFIALVFIALIFIALIFIALIFIAPIPFSPIPIAPVDGEPGVRIRGHHVPETRREDPQRFERLGIRPDHPDLVCIGTGAVLGAVARRHTALEEEFQLVGRFLEIREIVMPNDVVPHIPESAHLDFGANFFPALPRQGFG
jgi:hypothetical protein